MLQKKKYRSINYFKIHKKINYFGNIRQQLACQNNVKNIKNCWCNRSSSITPVSYFLWIYNQLFINYEFFY